MNRSTRFTELSVRELYMVPAATGFLQPPPPMELRTSSPAITWKKWRQRFEIYMTAAGKTEAKDDVKTSLLLHAIGPEGIEIFNTFTFTEEEESIKYTSTHFVPKVNLTYERHRYVIWGATPDEHDQRLRQVLASDRCRENGLKLIINPSVFFVVRK